MPDTAPVDKLDLLTPVEVAGLLRVSPATVKDWRKTRTGPRYARTGKVVTYRRADVIRWWEARSRASYGP